MGVARTAERLLIRAMAAASILRSFTWPIMQAVGRWPPLARLHAALARMPPWLALPMFLVPELCSRAGWVASVWLLLAGHPGRAMAAYVVTKILAGGTALWIYFACEPALLRVGPFAAAHRTLGRFRRAATGRLRAWLRIDADASAFMARNAGPGPVPARASSPTAPHPTE